MIFTGLQKSLSRLEMTVAVIIILLVTGLFLRQVMVMSARAERYFLEATVINMNTALYYYAGILKLNGRLRELENIGSVDPFLLMENPIGLAGDNENRASSEDFTQRRSLFSGSRYRGELSVAENPDPGYWYFDSEGGQLVYFVSNDEFFHSDGEGPPAIRFEIELDYEDLNGDGKFNIETDIYRGIRLKDRGGYQWEI